MSEVHNNDIRELLDVIPVIPHNLMMEYLTRQYNMTPNKAREVIYNACRKGSNRRPACYVTNDGLAKADYVTMTSLYRKRCRAFRVACEFLPEGRQFSIPSTCVAAEFLSSRAVYTMSVSSKRARNSLWRI